MLQLMIDATGEEKKTVGEAEKSGCPFHKMAGKMTSEEVVGHARVVLLAGYETTANTLAYTSYLLAINSDIQEKLQSEIDSYFDENPVSLLHIWWWLICFIIFCVYFVRPQDASAYEASQEIAYLDNVIQESLRLYPPATRYISN